MASVNYPPFARPKKIPGFLIISNHNQHREGSASAGCSCVKIVVELAAATFRSNEAASLTERTFHAVAGYINVKSLFHVQRISKNLLRME